MEETIMEILKDIKPEVEFEGRTDFISGKLLKSLDLMTLLTELEDAFDVEIPVEDVVPENFESVETIIKLIEDCR